MKKVIMLMGLIILLIVTGCAKNEKSEEKEEVVKSVYCTSCGEKSTEVTKFCSSCGEEATWVSEKPKEKKEESKTDSKEETKKEESKADTKEETKKEVKNEDKVETKMIKVPNLEGDYLKYVEGLNIEQDSSMSVLVPEYEARGIVKSQLIKAGEMVPVGTTIRVGVYGFDGHYNPFTDMHECIIQNGKCVGNSYNE